MVACRIPHKLACHGRPPFHFGEDRTRLRSTEGTSCGRECYTCRVGVGGSHIQFEQRARQHASVFNGFYMRRLVVARDDIDLHVAHHTAYQHARAPLLNEDGDVVLSLHRRRVPYQIARVGVDSDAGGGGRQLVAGHHLTIIAAARDETVRKAVAIGIVSTGVMVVGHAHTAVVDRRIEQLRRVVAAQERIDYQNGFQKEGDVDRVGDIDDARIAVRVLKSNRVLPRRRKSVLSNVSVHADFVLHVDFAGTGNGRCGAVAPQHVNLGAVGGTGRISVSDNRKLVG